MCVLIDSIKRKGRSNLLYGHGIESKYPRWKIVILPR